MQIIKMKIADLHAPEKNVRIHTDNQIDEFVRSIKMFGQIRPVVVDENNLILAGNGLVAALERSGVDTADVYKITNLSENQKKKLMIADNKIFGLGIENLDTLNDFLEELSGDLDIPGFDEDILKSMVADADDITEKLSEYGTLDEDEIEIIKKNGERKQEQIAKAQSDSESPAQPIAEHQEVSKADTLEETEDREFIICPRCGEKIWL